LLIDEDMQGDPNASPGEEGSLAVGMDGMDGMDGQEMMMGQEEYKQQ